MQMNPRVGPVDVTRVIDELVEAIESAGKPLTATELRSALKRTQIEVNVGLDRALTERTILKRVLTGAIRYGTPEMLNEKAKPQRGRPQPEYQPRGAVNQTSPAKAPLSDAGPKEHSSPGAEQNSPVKGQLKPRADIVPASDGLGLAKRTEMVVRAHGLDGTPRSNRELIERIAPHLRTHQTYMSLALDSLISKGIAERIGAGNKVRYRLKEQSSQPAPAREQADQPTVSSEAAPIAAPDNNGGNCSSAGCPSPDAAPDGAARHSTGGAEHPADALTDMSQWEPEPAAIIPPAATAKREDLFALRSDGRLQMILEGEEILLSIEATRGLFNYLDVINYDAIAEQRA